MENYEIISGTTYRVTADTPERALEVFQILALGDDPVYFDNGDVVAGETCDEIENDTVFTYDPDAPSVTLSRDIWLTVLQAIEEYANDPDARDDYPETALALDAAYSAINHALPNDEN